MNQTYNLSSMMMPQGLLSNDNDNLKMKRWSSDFGNDTLLGMTASMFDVQQRSLPRSIYSSLPIFQDYFAQEQGRAVNVNEITSQVLAELSDGMFDPPVEDIFDDVDMEPVPLNMNNNIHSNRFSLLESTLDQVLALDDGFLLQETPTSAVAPPTQIIHKRELDSQEGQPLQNKRQRVVVDESEEDAARRFRPYQSGQWSDKFDELMIFKKERGHSCVPHTLKENPALARWVKRQRYQYKLKNEGKASTMTDERVVALENAGFVWDSHGAAWMERLNELQDYRVKNEHCNVPSNFPENPQLATWVKCQRRQYKLFRGGKPSNMTLERIAELEKLDFGWELRGLKKESPTKSNNNKFDF